MGHVYCRPVQFPEAEEKGVGVFSARDGRLLAVAPMRLLQLDHKPPTALNRFILGREDEEAARAAGEEGR